MNGRTLVTVSAMARELRMSNESLRGLAREGIVPAYTLVSRSGRQRLLFAPDEVERHVEPYLGAVEHDTPRNDRTRSMLRDESGVARC